MPGELTVYTFTVPSGDPAGASGAFFGPVPGEDAVWQLHRTMISASCNPSEADSLRLSVFGTFDGPTVPVDSRRWFSVRGDRDTDRTRSDLLAVTMGGIITVVTPAREYRLKVSGGDTPSDPVNIRVMSIRSPW